MSTSTNEGEILSVKQVANFRKVAARRIYRLAAVKKIPPSNVDEIWRFSRADFDSCFKLQSMEAVDTGLEEGEFDNTVTHEFKFSIHLVRTAKNPEPKYPSVPSRLLHESETLSGIPGILSTLRVRVSDHRGMIKFLTGRVSDCCGMAI